MTPQRWKLTLEYDGTSFCGWQRQQEAPSVQACLEQAVFKFSGEQATLHVAGRTDAGVHALGQVAHLDLTKDFDAKAVRDAINFHVRPNAVAVIKAEKVPVDFHARFSAQQRLYCYKILMGRSAPPILDHNRVWHVWQDLDLDAMRQAAGYLIGHHDFSTFRASQCQAKSPLRTLDRLDVTLLPPSEASGTGQYVEIHAQARSFLHHQVRNMVGALKRVGEGKWRPQDLKDALDAKDRTQGAITAPACGLYFVQVDYPA